MSTTINSGLGKIWENAFNDKSLNKTDLSALKKEILADNKVSEEELSFLESKLGELTSPTEKAELSSLVSQLRTSKADFVDPNSMSFPVGKSSDSQVEAKRAEIVKNTGLIDTLLKSGKKENAGKAAELSKKVIEDLNFLKGATGEDSGDVKKSLETAIIASKLNLAAAYVVAGKMDAAKSILFSSPNKLGLTKAETESFAQGGDPASKALNDQYKRISGPVKTFIQETKKQEQQEAEVKAIQKDVKDLQGLLESGDPKAVEKSKAIISKIQTKFPENKELIAGMKLQLASALIQSKNYPQALSTIEEVKKLSENDSIKDRATFLQAQIHLKGQNLSKAMPLLNGLTKSSDVEIAKAAKEIKSSIESGYLDGVSKMADYNRNVLEKTWENKTPQSGWALLNPVTSVKMIAGHYDNLQTIHFSNLDQLGDIKYGAIMAQNLMKKTGKSLEEINKMSTSQISKQAHLSINDASNIKRVLSNPDVQKIMKGDFSNFSWDKNKMYITPEYMDTEFDIAAKWIGDQVKDVREMDELLMRSNSKFERVVGYTSAFVLDSLSDANHFVKDSIKTAHEYYSADDKKGTVLGWLGGTATTVGDILSSTVTAPATLADYKATDEERSEALKTTALIIGTMGVIKAGAPAWKSMGTGMATAGTWTAAAMPKISTAVATYTPKFIKAPIGKVAGSEFTQGLVSKTKAGLKATAEVGAKVKDALTKENFLVKPKDVTSMPTIEVVAEAKATTSGISKSQKFVNEVRDKVNKVPVVGKFVKSSAQIQSEMAAVGTKIETGFTGLMSRNASQLEAKGFTVPKTMSEFSEMVAKDPAKAKQMVTTSLLEEQSVKKGLDKVITEAKKGLTPVQLSKFDPDKAIQSYLLKSPEKFYDEFGGFLTEHFAKGLTDVQLKKAGLEYFTHYTNKETMSKILSSGKVLEQKWDIASGPIGNLTDDVMTGKLLNPLELKDHIISIATETRTWGFRGGKPLGLNDINAFDRTVASLNTSKTPEGVINVLMPSSKIGSPKDWKRISDFHPATQSLGTVRGGVELFPKELSESIISKADRQTLIKGISYQGTVPPEIINALMGTIGGISVYAGKDVEWGEFLGFMLEKYIPEKKEGPVENVIPNK